MWVNLTLETLDFKLEKGLCGRQTFSWLASRWSCQVLIQVLAGHLLVFHRLSKTLSYNILTASYSFFSNLSKVITFQCSCICPICTYSVHLLVA